MNYGGGPTGSLAFTPKPNANGVATVTVTVSDGDKVTTEDFVVLVGTRPDRPVIDTTFTPLLPAIKLPIPKGTQPEGGPVTTLTAHVADPDGDPKGVAITRVDAAAGTWEYFNGTTWSPIAGVSDTNALLLPADAVAKVRLVPGPKFKNKYASLSYRAWDRTAGTPFQLNAINVGTDTSVSTQTERAWIAVGKPKPVVDAAGHPNLTPVRPLNEDKTSPAFPVKNFLTFLGIEAKEAAPTVKAFGIAVSGATGGTWQFNTGKGGWRPLGVVSDGSALLLRATDRVRLIPTSNYSGPATITYHTWDLTAGSPGDPANTGAAGFSLDTETAVLTIAAVNDAPVVAAAPNLGTLAPGATTTDRTVAAFLLLGTVSDVDNPALGIQLLPAAGAVGVWQYKNANGNWVDVKKPTLLAPDVEIRFQAKATARAGTYGLSFKVWDQTGPSGTALSKVAKATLTIQ